MAFIYSKVLHIIILPKLRVWVRYTAPRDRSASHIRYKSVHLSRAYHASALRKGYTRDPDS